MSSKKAKSMFYAVRKGFKKGIFTEWEECKSLVSGYKNAEYKKFRTKMEAMRFLNGEEIPESTNKPKSKSSSKVQPQQIQAPEISDGVDVEVVYTDGSSLGNGKNGAKAGYGVYFGENDYRNLSARLTGLKQTNQRAEITAAIYAIKVASPHLNLKIMTDSQYLIKAMTIWRLKWEKNNFTTTLGKDVDNKDLFQQLIKLADERKKPIFWAHVGIEGNERADELAKLGALKDLV